MTLYKYDLSHMYKPFQARGFELLLPSVIKYKLALGKDTGQELCTFRSPMGALENAVARVHGTWQF